MPFAAQIICDGCQAKKMGTNHWYTITFRQQTAEVAVLTLAADGRPHAERDGVQQYYCGRYCILEAMNRWMDALNRQSSALPPQCQLENEQAGEQRIEPARTAPSKAIVVKRNTDPGTNTLHSDRPK